MQKGKAGNGSRIKDLTTIQLAKPGAIRLLLPDEIAEIKNGITGAKSNVPYWMKKHLGKLPDGGEEGLMKEIGELDKNPGKYLEKKLGMGNGKRKKSGKKKGNGAAEI